MLICRAFSPHMYIEIYAFAINCLPHLRTQAHTHAHMYVKKGSIQGDCKSAALTTSGLSKRLISMFSLLQRTLFMHFCSDFLRRVSCHLPYVCIIYTLYTLCFIHEYRENKKGKIACFYSFLPSQFTCTSLEYLFSCMCGRTWRASCI